MMTAEFSLEGVVGGPRAQAQSVIVGVCVNDLLPRGKHQVKT